MRRIRVAGVLLCILAVEATAQIVVPGADGSDGEFNPTNVNTVVDLSLAPTGAWNGTNQSPGSGVYDPNQWAVVFRYSSVNIPNIYVTFKNHPSRAPVLWLVSGNVTINGNMILDGQSNAVAGLNEPGPGGFRGGKAYLAADSPGGAGFGPGGGVLYQAPYYFGAGSYSTLGIPAGGPTYGNARILPLVGGSGEGGWSSARGAAGGGAILVAATNTIAIESGGIYARGFNNAYGASGGAIRLVGDYVTGTSGVLRAHNVSYPDSGQGRIRIEANHDITLHDTGLPPYTRGPSGAVATIWPADDSPTVRAISLGGISVPTDPRARFDWPLADVALADPNAQVLLIEARHVPLNWNVLVRVVPNGGQDIVINATYVSGDVNLSTWRAALSFSSGFSAVQVRASAP